MKTQLNPAAAGRKLSLNKKTISNLTASEMNKMIGATSCGCTDSCQGCHYTKGADCKTYGNGNTCPGHNTCPGYSFIYCY